jgi:hypothetical protein
MPRTIAPISVSKPRERPRTRKAVTLSDNAPFGTFLVDLRAEELRTAGGSRASQVEFVKSIRQKITCAAQLAIAADADHRVLGPGRLFLTKRLFRDLSKVRSLIERNRSSSAQDVLDSTKRIRPRSRPLLVDERETDEIRRLQTALECASEAITTFQTMYEPQGTPGNHDPLTRTFIENVFELWIEHRWSEESPDEPRCFIGFLAAAWGDVQFPTKDHEGQPLEEWLTDRVRKQFPDGVGRSRISRQSLILYERFFSG